MDTKSKGLAYFGDGHTEEITKFEISKDSHNIWFVTETDRRFIFKEELVYPGRQGRCEPEYKFYEEKFYRDYSCEIGPICDIRYLVTDEIERIRICVS